MFDDMKKVLFVSSLGLLMSILLITQSNVRAELVAPTDNHPAAINTASVAASVPNKLTPTEIDNVGSQLISSETNATVNQDEITGQEQTMTTAVIPSLPMSERNARIEQVRDFLKIEDNRHACAIKTDHTLWCWGANQFGQLGDGTVADAAMPVQIGSDNQWQLVKLGDRHTCAIKQDASLWCWGANQFGQLGDGTKVARSLPINVGNSSDWVKVDAKQRSTCALKSNDALFCWGKNDVKLESVADTDNQSPPAIDSSHSNQNQPVQCGTKADGTVWCVTG